jgi:hypothetical protein
MKFIVKGRQEMESFETKGVWIWLSFHGPDEEKADISNYLERGCIDVLQLEFHDVDDRFKDLQKEYPTSSVGKKLKFFDDSMAVRIVEFVRKNLNFYDDIHTIVCQCEAGVSRSAGAAAALSKCINGSDREYFNSIRYIPNMLVYRKIMNAWYD